MGVSHQVASNFISKTVRKISVKIVGKIIG